MKRIVFRADAGLEIGSGHVMRCLTLAALLREHGATVSFICREHPGHLCDLIAARGFGVARLAAPTAAASVPNDYEAWLGTCWQDDAAQTGAAIGAAGAAPDWLIIDHYALDSRWEGAQRHAARNIMVIDDLALRPHDCDLLLDQNMAEDLEHRYDQLTPASCHRLLGPSFSLLRPEFGAARGRLRERDGSVRRLFVFIGGADPDNETGKVLQAIAQLKRAQLSVDVVIGGANPHRAQLAALCAALPAARLHQQVGNIAELMAQADLAIGSGGGAMWERCCLGLPSVVIGIAENQVGGSEAMARQGRILYLGRAGQASPSTLANALELACSSPWLLHHLSRSGMACVDGRGAERVARLIMRHRQAPHIALRPAAAADCDPIYHWRNADEVRRCSGNSASIALDAHRRWFAAVLADPERQIMLGEIGGRVIGVLRYDRDATVATISVYLTPGNLGQGLGPALIAQGSDWLRAHWPQVETIEARVKPDNPASAAAFAAAGFTQSYNVFARKIRD